MTLEIFIALSAFAFVGSITPGPNNLMLMASGINYGFARSLPHMFGIGVGFSIMILLVGFGLMELFKTYPAIYSVLRVAGIGYLLYLAYKIATAEPSEKKADEQASGKPFTFLQAALFQWVNPKAWMMVITAITTYAPSSQPVYSVLMIALIFILVMLPSISTWVVLGTQMQRFLNNPIKVRIFNRIAAALLVASLIPVFF